MDCSWAQSWTHTQGLLHMTWNDTFYAIGKWAGMTLFTQQQQTRSKFKKDWSHSHPLGTVVGLLRGEGYVKMVKKQFFEKAITTSKLLRIHSYTAHPYRSLWWLSVNTVEWVWVIDYSTYPSYQSQSKCSNHLRFIAILDCIHMVPD